MSYKPDRNFTTYVSLSSEALKRAADMVRAGGVLLAETCPKCGIPLVKIKKRIVCPSCEAEVRIVKGAEDEAEALLDRALNELLLWVSHRINDLVTGLRDGSLREEDALEILTKYMEIIERMRKVRIKS